MIQFQCACGKALQASEEHAGMQVTCPACNRSLTVPGAPAHAYQPAAPPPPMPYRPPERVSSHPGGPPRQHRREAQVSGKALGSLITGILTFLLPVLLAIPAIILGFLARRDVRQSRGALTGGGLALAGIICGFAGNITLVPIWLIWGSIADQRALADSQNNLKQLALAMHGYHDAYKAFPPAAGSFPGKSGGLSWRVAVLPYIEQAALYNQFKHDEPWDSPHNIQLLPRMPKLYAPTKGSAQPGYTYYQVFTGPKTPFVSPQQRMRITGFMDGTSNTLLIVEGSEAVPWTKPADIAVGPGPLTTRVGGQWRGGFNAAFADGSVRWLSFDRVGDHTLRLLVDPDDRQVIPDLDGRR